MPNLLGVIAPERVLPAHTIEVARGLAHFVVENAKPARAFLRSLGAPDDAHPRVGVNEDYEVTMMICVVERPTVQASSAS